MILCHSSTYTKSQFGVSPLSLILLDEVVHAEKSSKEIVSLISDSDDQGYKRYSCKEKCDTS